MRSGQAEKITIKVIEDCSRINLLNPEYVSNAKVKANAAYLAETMAMYTCHSATGNAWPLFLRFQLLSSPQNTLRKRTVWSSSSTETRTAHSWKTNTVAFMKHVPGNVARGPFG
jgi:hypothetical protein